MRSNERHSFGRFHRAVFAFRARVSVIRAGRPSSTARGGGNHAGSKEKVVSGAGPLVALKISVEKADYPTLSATKMIFFGRLQVASRFIHCTLSVTL
jgi:hypothetical protein